MVSHPYVFALSIANKAGKDSLVPIIKSQGMSPIDYTTIAMLEALYNGSCRKSAEFKQVTTASGLIALTGITIPSKNFMKSSLSQKPIHKLTAREHSEYMAEYRDKEMLLIYATQKTGSTTEMQIKQSQKTLYYIRNMLIMSVGAPDMRMEGQDSNKKRELVTNALNGLINAYCGSDANPDPIILRSEAVFDRIKISKNGSVSKSAEVSQFVQDLRKTFSL